MIKILKPGQYYIATCNVCGSAFTYEDEDIRCETQEIPFKNVKCPCCGVRILLLYKTNRNY